MGDGRSEKTDKEDRTGRVKGLRCHGDYYNGYNFLSEHSEF